MSGPQWCAVAASAEWYIRLLHVVGIQLDGVYIQFAEYLSRCILFGARDTTFLTLAHLTHESYGGYPIKALRPEEVY